LKHTNLQTLAYSVLWEADWNSYESTSWNS